MDEVKRVKVDNWGIYFLQRLKHFFNRTDFCDLTLQFQDKAQLKVHRLVLSACTEYFEVLERTCEMYDDCLVMPDDLQADVVVPIVNFMYTGHLEFKMDLLEKLYLTSQVMRMPVLTKLLEAHRVPTLKPAFSKSYSKPIHKQSGSGISASSVSLPMKRSYSKAFNTPNKTPSAMPAFVKPTTPYLTPYVHKKVISDPKPTRYEVPEELESDELESDSFTNISYESKPLMIHLENTKNTQEKKIKLSRNTNAKEILHGSSTVKIIDNIQVTHPSQPCSIYDADIDIEDHDDIFQTPVTNIQAISQRNMGQLFDEPLEVMPKVTLETNDLKQSSNLDHAKIISEVLKKYPHLLKSNKNIKLKILNTGKNQKHFTAQQLKAKKFEPTPVDAEPKVEKPDFVDIDILDAKKAAKLISMGAQNTKGPWVCLICGTPGRAILFKSYYTFRRHLVDVHNEKPLLKICEYCGANTPKRNIMFHHLLTKHCIEPPPSYNFPKCNMCDYVGLSEALLIRHKVSHTESKNFKCNVCMSMFSSSTALLLHIQKTGHKYTSEKKCDLQCIYCLRVFTRKVNLYAHIKTNHKQLAKLDGVIEDSDEEKQDVVVKNETNNSIQYDTPINYEHHYEPSTSEDTQKILNSSFPAKSSKVVQKPKILKQVLNKPETTQNEYSEQTPNDHIIVTIDGEEYMVKNDQLIPYSKTTENEEYIISGFVSHNETTTTNSLLQNPTTSMEFGQKPETTYLESLPGKLNKKPRNIEQPIQIVVSNDEEYKALMSTNHSIIFNDVESNKTLTVLTTAENTDLNNRTIDVDVAQSNEMVILPGNYPLNVSSAVTANNSNIVVVYSHPQEMSAQFVPSGAVHYETISPATAIINTDTMHQDQKSWQNELQQDTVQSVHEPMALVEQNNLVQQPEVEIEEVPSIQLTQPTEMSQTYTQEEVTLSQTYTDENQHTDTKYSESVRNIANEEVNSIPTVPLQVLIPAELHSSQECNASTMLQSAEIQEASVQVEMPQFEEQSVTVFEVNQDENNIEVGTIKETATIENMAELQNNNKLLNSETAPFIIQEPIELISSNVEISTVSHSKDNLDTLQELQNNTVQETSSDQVFENTHIENHDEKRDGTIIINEIPHETELVLPKPVECVSNNTEEVSPEFVQLSQDFDQSKSLLVCKKEPEIVDNAMSNEVENTIEISTIQNDTSNDENLIPNTETITLKVPEVVVKEKIQSLTSEWSEDEIETSEKEADSRLQIVNANMELEKSTLTTDDISNISVDTDEIEESIENIQQEMEKQMAEAITEAELNVSSKVEKMKQNELEKIPKEIEVTNNGCLPPEQISSLLNDWEDNDDQRENTTPTEQTVTIQQKSVTETLQGPVVEESQTNDDRIKNLVSDWDDDEENKI